MRRRSLLFAPDEDSQNRGGRRIRPSCEGWPFNLALPDQGFLFVLKRREVDSNRCQLVGFGFLAERQCGLGRGIEFIHDPFRERFRIKPSERRRQIRRGRIIMMTIIVTRSRWLIVSLIGKKMMSKVQKLSNFS
jgi:hypothetical protein